MTEMTREEWMKINQHHLIAEINVIKARLLLFKDKQEEEKTTDKNTQLLEEANNNLAKTENELNVQTRLNTLVELFQLSSFEKNILLLGLGIELDASLGKLINKTSGNSNNQLPTLSLALSLFPDAHWSAITPGGPLRYWQLIEVNKNPVLTSSTFSIDETVLHYLTGINTIDSRLHHFVSLLTTTKPLVPSHQKITRQIAQYLSQTSKTGRPPIIQLKGSSIADQKAISANTFAEYNLSIYNLPVSLMPTNFQEVSNLIQLWNREAILHQYVLFLDGSNFENLSPPVNGYVIQLLENVRGLVLISTAHKFENLDRALYTIEVDKPLREEQTALWKQQLGADVEILEGTIGSLVTQFNLDSHSINHLAEMALANQSTNGTLTATTPTIKDKLWNACCNYTRPNLSGLAQRIETMASWDDLVLPQSQKNILKDICIHVQQRQKVYNEWGFSNKGNRGLGISALFAGESGTGKTMASEVIANALRLDLYRIDLSQVVNKYIGETEKNLKKIFDAAEDSGAILLFDEADALFGKRSDVKDSHDRYSNIEVSYLLQKMEEYRGLAILTTNMKKALDKAFLRRIRFVIQFPFPDARMRGEIWKRVFPKETPTKDLSIQKLANLNIAGGNIRNIALNASFMAAHKNQPVTMRDIHNAARNEYIKLEKHMSPSESLI